MNMGTAATTEINVGTAARILKVSPDTVNRLCDEGTLRAWRVPPRGWWRIDFDSVMTFLQMTRKQ